jgi:hypothetical protein
MSVTKLSTNQFKDVHAPISAVWSKLNNFHALTWAPIVIKNLEKVGDVPGTAVGAKRVLNNAIYETLVTLDAQAFLLEYSIDDGPSPISKIDVSDYVAHIKLTTIAGTNNTHVEWSSTWDANDDAAVEFCRGIYVALLNSLAESFY